MEKQVISTLNENGVRHCTRNTEGLAPCTHEEADNRMMLHIADAARQHKAVLICTVDSDVVVLAVYVFQKLQMSLTALWMVFGTGKHLCMVTAHDIST